MPRLFAAVLAAAFAMPALAHDYTLGALRIGHPWSRAAPPNAPAAVYFTLNNSGKQADQLLSVTSPIAAEAMLHQNLENNGVMQMRELAHGVALPPGATVKLQPGGLHVMLIGIKQPLPDGAKFPLTLRFAKAGRVTVEVMVGAAPAH